MVRPVRFSKRADARSGGIDALVAGEVERLKPQATGCLKINDPVIGEEGGRSGHPEPLEADAVDRRVRLHAAHLVRYDHDVEVLVE